MKIGINAYEANVTHRVGSNVYAFRMLVELEKLSQGHEVVVYLPTAPVADFPPERPGWKYRVIPPGKLWTQWRLPLELFLDHAKKPFDVFYSLGHYAPRWSPCPSVVSLMDLAFLRYPELFRREDVYKLTSWTEYSVRHASGVVAISEATKKDVQEWYRFPEKNIVVAYPGRETMPALSNEEMTSELQKMQIHRPYIVYIGTIQPRKNIIRVIHAFERLCQRQPELELVLAGKVGWMADDILKTIRESPVTKHIRLLGFVSEKQKWALLRGAKASVLVGLYEGFGIPALESLQAGTPPVVANTASLPEVVESCGWLADPTKEEEIATALEKAVQWSQSERSIWARDALKQTEKFAWSHSAQTVWNFLLTNARRSDEFTVSR